MRETLNELRFRFSIAMISVDRVVAHQLAHMKSDAQGLIGAIRWVFFPRKYSVAHLDLVSRASNPYGTHWVKIASSDVEICSGCRTGRPIDFVRFASKYHRWNARSAREEIQGLIERGELADNPETHNRWRIIPQGSMLIYTTGLEERIPVITAMTHDGAYYSMATSHLIDLPASELEVVAKFFAEVIPEWTFERSQMAIHTSYDGSLDAMAGLTPAEFRFTAPGGVTPLSVIYTEEK